MIKTLPTRVAAIAIATLPLLATASVMSVLPFDQAEAQNRGNGNGGGGGSGNGGNGNAGGGNGGNGNGGNGGGDDRGGPPAHANAGGHRGNVDDSGETTRRAGPPAHANAGGNLQGRIARELGGANASNASAQAFANAADDSMIGRLRDVYDVFGETDGAEATLNDAQTAFDQAVAEYLAEDGDLRLRDAIEVSLSDVDQRITDLNAIEPAPDDFDDQLAALEEERAGYVEELDLYQTALGDAEDALGAASEDYSDALAAEDEALATVTNQNFELSDEARDELRSRLFDRLGDPNSEVDEAAAPEDA